MADVKQPTTWKTLVHVLQDLQDRVRTAAVPAELNKDEAKRELDRVTALLRKMETTAREECESPESPESDFVGPFRL